MAPLIRLLLSSLRQWWHTWIRKTLLIVSGPLLFYLLFINHVEPSELGLARNSIGGKIWLQSPGWHCTPLWVRVNNVDGRPMRVSVQSGGRGYSAKLVQFNPEYYKEFVETEGFRYYWWSNRFSVNFGHDEEHRGMRDIMRGYAYGAKKYPFITVVDDLAQ